METFSLSILVLSGGALFALVSGRLFSFMKAGYTLLTCGGCLIGLFAAGSALFSQHEISPFSVLWLDRFSLTFSLDNLSSFFLIPIFTICPLAALYSLHYMDKPNRSVGTAVNNFFFSLLIISMALVATAKTVFAFALSWEVMSLSSFFLVMFDHTREETRKAGYIYLIFTQIGALFLFAAFALAYSHTGSLELSAFATLPATAKRVVFFLALVGFGSKAGIFPIHMWLPHAHPAAPSNISAVMSGVMIKIGIYGIVRFYGLLEATDVVIGQVILVFGMISGILGVVYALSKHDLKRLLAYHSVENIGIILIGAGVGMLGVSSGDTVMATFGFLGSLLHVINHSIFKSLLFLGAGAVLQKTGIRQIDQLGGLMKKMPTTGRSFMVGSISISGLPPFNGFVSEFLIYYAAFHGLALGSSFFIFAMLAILSLAMIGGLAAACFSKVVGIVFLGEPRTEGASQATEAGFAMTIPMVLLSVACILIGIFPEPFVRMCFAGLNSIPVLTTIDYAQTTTITANLALAARSLIGLFLLSFLLQKILYLKKEITRSSTWGCGFTQPSSRMQYTGTSYAMSLVELFRPFVRINTHYKGFSRIFPGRTHYDTHVDDISETTLHDYLVTPLLYLVGKLRWIQHGHIQLYIGYIIVTIIVLMFFI